MCEQSPRNHQQVSPLEHPSTHPISPVHLFLLLLLILFLLPLLLLVSRHEDEVQSEQPKREHVGERERAAVPTTDLLLSTLRQEREGRVSEHLRGWSRICKFKSTTSLVDLKERDKKNQFSLLCVCVVDLICEYAQFSGSNKNRSNTFDILETCLGFFLFVWFRLESSTGVLPSCSAASRVLPKGLHVPSWE